MATLAVKELFLFWDTLEISLWVCKKRNLNGLYRAGSDQILGGIEAGLRPRRWLRKNDTWRRPSRYLTAEFERRQGSGSGAGKPSGPSVAIRKFAPGLWRARSAFLNLQPRQKYMILMCFFESEVRSTAYPKRRRT
jgi:hypothetical protein